MDSLRGTYSIRITRRTPAPSSRHTTCSPATTTSRSTDSPASCSRSGRLRRHVRLQSRATQPRPASSRRRLPVRGRRRRVVGPAGGVHADDRVLSAGRGAGHGGVSGVERARGPPRVRPRARARPPLPSPVGRARRRARTTRNGIPRDRYRSGRGDGGRRRAGRRRGNDCTVAVLIGPGSLRRA